MVSSSGRNLNNVRSLSFSFFHDGHCASGWMGGNKYDVETVDDCAAVCSGCQGCGFFAYDNARMTCATYFESDGCPDDNHFPEYNAYKMGLPTSPTSVPSTAPTPDINVQPSEIPNFAFLHNGHCASGWMGNNRNVDTVDECATICGEREGCGYFAYDNSISSITNCATYFGSDGCPDENLFPEYNAYEIVTSPTPLPSIAPISMSSEENGPDKFSFSFFHNGHCASGWMDDNRNVDTVDECAIICGEREGCGYFAYDASMSYATNCATYFDTDDCLDDNLFPQFNSYKIGPSYSFSHDGHWKNCKMDRF